jgi:hypothetical protein
MKEQIAVSEIVPGMVVEYLHAANPAGPTKQGVVMSKREIKNYREWDTPVSSTTRTEVRILDTSTGLQALVARQKGIGIFENTHQFTLVKQGRAKAIQAVRELMNRNTLTVPGISYAGADPEVFAVRGTGELIPAWEYLPPKEKGIPVMQDVAQQVDGGFAYYDGFQAEFTTIPVQCHGYFTDRVRMGLKAVLTAARKVDETATLLPASALPISRPTLEACDPDQIALGCSPSQNVYGEPRMAVPDPMELGWRFAGCHLHYGTPDVPVERVTDTVRLLDAVAGVMGVAMGGELGVELGGRERRRWYGRAGEFRYHPATTGAPDSLPQHRLEYRVPDQILLCHPATFNLFVDVARMVMKLGASGQGFLWDAEEDEVREVVNECDWEGARRIIRKNERVFQTIVARCYGVTEHLIPSTLRTVYEGLVAVVGKPKDVVGNWVLEGREIFGRELDHPHNWGVEGYRTYGAPGKTWVAASGMIAQGKMI